MTSKIIKEGTLDLVSGKDVNCNVYKGCKLKTTEYIKPVTVNQQTFDKFLRNKIISIGIGAAGTGKTLLSLFNAVKLYNNENSTINKIIYIRANTGIWYEKDIGALPGDLHEKVTALAYPVLDNLTAFMSESDAKACLEFGIIEVLPLSHVIGRSLRNTFIICDEAQRIEYPQLKSIITRIGEGSRLALIGDPRQDDRNPKFITPTIALLDITTKLYNFKEVGVVQFESEDVVRHPFLQNIIDVL